MIALLLNPTLGYYTATLLQSQTSLAAFSSKNGLVFFPERKMSFGTYRCTMDIFNSMSEKHRTANLSVFHGFLTARHAGEKIIFAGSILIETTATTIVDMYSIATETWKDLKDLKEQKMNRNLKKLMNKSRVNFNKMDYISEINNLT